MTSALATSCLRDGLLTELITHLITARDERTCDFLPDSSFEMASSALYVARRVIAISDFICSTYASTWRLVADSWSRSD